jgi:ABC-type multidrug transport system fused ATPase/permease subunit
MKLPSWSNFLEGVSNFEQSVYHQKEKLTERIQDLKDDHRILDEITKRSIPFLPSPFNGIAQALYDSFDGSAEEKTDEIQKFLDDIKRQGEDHYTKITSDMDDIMKEIFNVKTITAKALQLIKDILISNAVTATKKLDLLKTELDKVVKLEDLYQSYGLKWLPHNYFEDHRSTKEDFSRWMDGFSFELESIKDKQDFRRNTIIDYVTSKLESQHRLLIVGESGTSKSTILYEIICDYFDKGYEILYNFGNTELKNDEILVEFIESLLNEDNRLLVAVDNIHSLMPY